MATTSSKVKIDDFTKKVRPSAAATDAIVYVEGYVGESPSRGSVRVYLDPSLNSFVDIPQKDIVHSMPVKDDPNGLGGSKLWVKLPPVTEEGNPALEFTQGDLFNDYLQKIYDQETKKPGSVSATKNATLVFGSDIVAGIDYKNITNNCGSDFTRPGIRWATDITVVAQTDITRPAVTVNCGSDFTKPAITDFTRYLFRRPTITFIKTIGVSRGCPMGQGPMTAMANTGYY